MINLHVRVLDMNDYISTFIGTPWRYRNTVNMRTQHVPVRVTYMTYRVYECKQDLYYRESWYDQYIWICTTNRHISMRTSIQHKIHKIHIITHHRCFFSLGCSVSICFPTINHWVLPAATQIRLTAHIRNVDSDDYLSGGLPVLPSTE
jgi:hypothetical protein